MNSALWRVRVDTGGTFTDCLAVSPEGRLKRVKVLSSSALRGLITGALDARTLRIEVNWDAPDNFVAGWAFRLLHQSDQRPQRIAAYQSHSNILTLAEPLAEIPDPGTAFEALSPYEAPILAARLVTGTPPGTPLPPLELRLATTRGTNALLTKSGTPPALFITSGFADLLTIGTQQRPDLFALDITRPSPLHGPVIEVRERLAADGTVLIPLDEEEVKRQAQRLLASGVTSAAVALLHSALHPEPERRLGELLAREGFTHISLSSALAPFVKILPRAETAVVNAYLAPVIEGYIDAVVRELPEEPRLMSSAGGLTPASSFQPRDSLLSGPAGGIVGAAGAGRDAGFHRIIAFDMGGTSTDVARYSGDFEYTFEQTVGDAHLVAPALAIESVAAGGGSICAVDRQGVRVGPESAGAFPGPACYGAGGPLTLTDVNLLLGRLLPDRFEIPLSAPAAQSAAQRLRESLQESLREESAAPLDNLLEGLLEIANERMADAIRKISVRRGYDPAEYALVSFGGAGGQHACAVAAKLGMTTVVIPPDASLLSARGIGEARVERFAERQILRPLNDFSPEEIARLLQELAQEARATLAAEAVRETEIRRQLLYLRLTGQEATLPLEYSPDLVPGEAFFRRYQELYGHYPPATRTIELESVRVVVSERRTDRQEPGGAKPIPREATSAPFFRPVRFGGDWHDTAVYQRPSLSSGTAIPGPALIVERHSVVVVEPGWTAAVHPESYALLLTQSSATPLAPSPTEPDAVTDELFSARFAALAEEMGEMLQRTALSVNVKERLDFSCALLGPDGNLIASAAHIPVHLGALGACVRRLRETVVLAPGDVLVVNHPAFGGSHLPDITVVTPVYSPDDLLLGYVANRAHHGEIGGTRPGSMPPDAATLAEEGVVLPPTHLVYRGESRLDQVCALLQNAPYPSRALSDNRADLEAALAANRRGAGALLALAETYGPAMVWRQMERLTARAERLLRSALAAIPDGVYTATELLDDGSPLVVRITISGDSATLDFSGTAPTHPGNLNAPPAVATSAALYVLRLLVGEPLPLNEGLLRPIRLILPPGSLVNPEFDPEHPARCPAVVGGNTETSQRLVAALLKALQLAAGAQGTMNNILFGNGQFGYYETVCGGAGATRNAPGASAVHTHMTNTRITDVEVLERRYPVRVERFAIRQGSGGAGRHSGGDGALREYTFLAPMALSLLTQNRVRGPFGLAGGEPGQPGRQTLVRADGTVEELPSIARAEVQAGDRLLLETPGGGGWGVAPSS